MHKAFEIHDIHTNAKYKIIIHPLKRMGCGRGLSRESMAINFLTVKKTSLLC